MLNLIKKIVGIIKNELSDKMENMLFELKEMKNEIYNMMIELDLKITNNIISYTSDTKILLELSDQMERLVVIYKNLDNAIHSLEVGHE